MSKTPHRTTFRHDAKFFLQDTFRPILWAHPRGPDDTPSAGAGHALTVTPPAKALSSSPLVNDPGRVSDSDSTATAVEEPKRPPDRVVLYAAGRPDRMPMAGHRSDHRIRGLPAGQPQAPSAERRRR